MNNCSTGQSSPARQMTEKVALYECIMHLQAGWSHSALVRWRLIVPCCVSNCDVFACFSFGACTTDGYTFGENLIQIIVDILNLHIFVSSTCS